MAEVVLRHEALRPASADALCSTVPVPRPTSASTSTVGPAGRSSDAVIGPVSHRARQFQPAWLNERDLVVAMDNSHVRWLRTVSRRPGPARRCRLLLSYTTGGAGGTGSLEIPDPWYGDEAEFEIVPRSRAGGVPGSARRVGCRSGPG